MVESVSSDRHAKRETAEIGRSAAERRDSRVTGEHGA